MHQYPAQDPKGPLKLPFKLAQVQAANAPLKASDTYTLDKLIGQLQKVVTLQNPHRVITGLKIAKVFRNKEGHVVTGEHKYDPPSYRAIEVALVELYAAAYGKKLTVRFSFAPKEKGAWTVAP